MAMANTGWQREDAKVFHYGFLSSRTSGALKEYIDHQKVTDESKEILQNAYALLGDILTAQKLFGNERQNVAPSATALDAFGCALEVIISHRQDFNVTDVKGLIALFKTLHRTLDKLLQGKKPLDNEVETTRIFFQRLATLMLAQLSVPKENYSFTI